MNIYTVSSDQLKDIFYTFGILTTFILSSVNILLAFKNRKNSLRESLYKEQLMFVSNLMSKLYELHSDLSKMMNPNFSSDVSSKIEAVFGIMYSNVHIGNDNIVSKTTQTITAGMEFLVLSKSEDKDLVKKKFDFYFKNYCELIQVLRHELGVEPLSIENQKLYKSMKK